MQVFRVEVLHGTWFRIFELYDSGAWSSRAEAIHTLDRGDLAGDPPSGWIDLGLHCA